MLPLDGITLADLAKRATQMDLRHVMGETPVLVFRPGPGDGPLLFVTPPDGEEVLEEPLLLETQPTVRRRKESMAPRGYASPAAVVVPLTKSSRDPEMDAEVVRIGRARTNDIRLTSDQVSKVHAHFEKAEVTGAPSWQIVDHGSVNGTFVNGLRLDKGTAYTIRPGDEVRFADVNAVLLDPAGLVALCAEIVPGR